MDYEPKSPSGNHRKTVAQALTPHRPAQLLAANIRMQRQAAVAQQLVAHTLRPVAVQRQQMGSVIQALGLQRDADEGLKIQRQHLQDQLGRHQVLSGVAEGALQRQEARQAPVPPLLGPPVTPSDWVQAARLEVQRVQDPASPDQTRWMSGTDRERHVGTLRSVGHGLVQGFKTDPRPAVQRYAEYGEQLATLQRQPLTSGITRAVLQQTAPTERVLLQRAVDEAMQRHSEQEAEDQSVLHLHGLQRQLADFDRQADQSIMDRIQARRGNGAPLPVAVQRQLEAGLNHDFSGVRVHIDAEADLLSKKVNATAFTTGQDIYFQSGKFDPNSQTGVELLAHEATHVRQQASGQVGQGIDPDAGLEAEARSVGRQFSQGTPPKSSSRPRLSSVPSRGSSLQRAVVPATVGRAPTPVKAKKPDPAEYARKLAGLLIGTPQHVATTKVTDKLDVDETAIMGHQRAQVLTSFGRGTTANLLGGTTRQLAVKAPGAPDRLQNYSLPMLNPAAVAAVASELNTLKSLGIIEPTLRSFEAQYGKSLYAALGERVRDAKLRSSLLTYLPAPISEAQLTRDAFLENLAVDFSYSNDSAEAMNAGDKREEGRGANAGQLLKSFGYTAGPPLSGRWGFQMRIFTPIPSKAKGKQANDPVIVAFRGTEGVALDPKSNPEGAMDTMIGDFAKAQPGYNQFDANAAWIEQTIKAAAKGGRVTMIGHSLGGALAQIAAARYPQLTGGVVIFQAANISQQDVAKVEAYNKAHPKQAIHSRSYRVDGDVVPTSGEATLPGEIYYFDRTSQALPQPKNPPQPAPEVKPVNPAPAGETTPGRWVREGKTWLGDEKDAGVSWAIGETLNYIGGGFIANSPYLNAAALSKGHVVPMLSTYIRGEQHGPTDSKRQALLAYGQRDANELPHQMKDANGNLVKDTTGKIIVTPPQERVQTVFSGNYSTARDPRLRGEPVRKNAVPGAVDLVQSYAGVFKDNIAYDTVLGHLYGLASKAKDETAFKKDYYAVLDHAQLELLPEDVALAKQLHLDISPRVNATAALKNIADFQRSDIAKATSNLSDSKWLLHPRTKANNFLNSKYDGQMEKYSTKPVLNEYKGKQKFLPVSANPIGNTEIIDQSKYSVEIPPTIRHNLMNPIVERAIWQLFHPQAAGKKKP